MGADFFFFFNLGPNVSDGSQHRSSTSHQHWAYPAWLHCSLNRTWWTQCTSTLNGSQRLPLKAKEQQNRSKNTLCKNWPDRIEIWPTGATIGKTFWRTSKDVWQTPVNDPCWYRHTTNVDHWRSYFILEIQLLALPEMKIWDPLCVIIPLNRTHTHFKKIKKKKKTLTNMTSWCLYILCNDEFRGKCIKSEKVAYLLSHSFGLAVPNAKPAWLIVQAVWTWYQLPECSWAWKPSFQI